MGVRAKALRSGCIQRDRLSHNPRISIKLVPLQMVAQQHDIRPAAPVFAGREIASKLRWNARLLKELEQENAKLKRLVVELSLDKLVLKDIAERNI